MNEATAANTLFVFLGLIVAMASVAWEKKRRAKVLGVFVGLCIAAIPFVAYYLSANG